MKSKPAQHYHQRYRQRTKQKAAAREVAQVTRIATTRTCGDCTLCCTVLGVDELQKPPGTSCQHLLQIGQVGEAPQGCSIYGQHPESCRAYACLWRTGGIRDEELRPDRIGVIFDQVMRLAMNGEELSIATRYKAINAREAYVGAADQGLARQALRVLGQWRPILTIGPDGQTRSLSGPDSLVQAMLKEANLHPTDLSTGKTILVD
jgi:hypothetical protein